jgi:glycosyltransferase involved in cell wall biosynthesis
MRILVGHNFYQQPGGEDAVFRSEVAMLKSFGHEVCLYERHNDEIKPDILSRISQAASMRYSKNSYDQMRSLIRSFKPDVAHFHNIFYMMTPSVLNACKDEGVPVVLSLHNFRLVCINGLFFRDGKPCEDCLSGSRMSGIIHRCYRGSLAFSALAADMTDYHWHQNTWNSVVDRFIVATEFSKKKYIQAGIPSDKLKVLPHFVQEPPQSDRTKSNYALYAGRLSQEKGVDVLLKAWRDIKEVPLYIVGRGPKQQEMEGYIKKHGMTNVKILGFLESQEYHKVLSQARFLVVPSVCYENFPIVVAEAFSYGLPVVASRLGTFEEIIEDNFNGRLFAPDDAVDLASKVLDIIADEKQYEKLCENARKAFEAKYTSVQHYQNLVRIYEGIDAKKN